MAWNGSNQRTEVSAKRPDARRGVLKGALAGIVVVALALGAFFALHWSGADVPAKEKTLVRDGKIAEVAPAAHVKRPKPATQKPAAAPANPVWAAAKGLDPALFPYTDGRKVVQTRTNMWQAVDICVMTNGIRRKVRRSVVKPLFRHVTDDILMQALSTGGDERGPAIPFSEDMEDDFRESLKTPITIDDDDTPEQRAVKEQVIAAREVVAEQLKEGRTFFDAITDHVATQASNESARETVMKGVQELKDGGDGDLVEEYLKESNKVLEQMGASPIRATDLEPDDEQE